MAGKKSGGIGTKRTAAKGAPQKGEPKKPAAAPSSMPLASARPAGPTARTCPLVLDGEVDASDFSPSDCLTCSEFDCRYCEAEQGSGTLRSRLFDTDDGGDDEDGFGGDFDFEGGGDEGFDDEGGEDGPL